MNAEDDVRMVLCACVISDLLGDWRGVDVVRATTFVERCLVSFPPLFTRFSQASIRLCSASSSSSIQTYEGGYGQRPGQEAQGSSRLALLVNTR